MKVHPMDSNEIRLRALELSCSIARDIGYLSDYRWKEMSNQERQDVFKTIFTMANDFSEFALKKETIE